MVDWMRMHPISLICLSAYFPVDGDIWKELVSTVFWRNYDSVKDRSGFKSQW